MNLNGKSKICAAAVAAGLALSTGTAPALAGTVRYDLNGPAGVVHEHAETGSVAIEEIGVDFEGLGALTGWNTRRDGTGKAYAKGDSVDGDATLYAQYADGTMLADDLVEIDGKAYFYRDGEPQSGLVKVEGLGGNESALAYFDPADGGAMARADKDGRYVWVEAEGKHYLADSDGVLAGTGDKSSVDGPTSASDGSGRTYLFGSDGAQRTGLVELDGKTFLFAGAPEEGVQDGYMVVDQLTDAASAGAGVAGASIYPTADGLATGLVEVESADGTGATAYFFGECGVSSAGWHKAVDNGTEKWVYTNLDGHVLATSASEPATVDRERLGGADSVKGLDTVKGADDYRLGKLGEAIASYMKSTAGDKAFDLELVEGSADERFGAKLSFSPTDTSRRTDTVSFAWDEDSQSFKATIEGTISVVTTPDTGKDEDEGKPSTDGSSAKGDETDEDSPGNGTTAASGDKSDDTDEGSPETGTSISSGSVSSGSSSSVPGTSTATAKASSGGTLPQTSVGAGALALTVSGTAAAALAGGKLAWLRLAAGGAENEPGAE